MEGTKKMKFCSLLADKTHNKHTKEEKEK